MGRKIFAAVLLFILCALLGMTVSCAKSRSGERTSTSDESVPTHVSLDGITFDVPSEETVEIGEAYLVCEKKAVGVDKRLYKPEVRVYCGDEDVTSELIMDVFFEINAFEPYRVDYIIERGDERKVFSTQLTVVDTTAPMVNAKNLPETMEFGSTFHLDKELFTVTDNSGEIMTPEFSVVQVNGSRRTTLEADDGGVYALDAGYVESIEINVTASDSHDNKLEETFIIGNPAAAPVALPQNGSNNNLWSNTEVDYYFGNETVFGTDATVLTMNMDVSKAKDTYLCFRVEFDNTLHALPGTLEFDILTENMCNWFSVTPYNGSKGTEVGVKGFGNGNLYHCEVELDKTIDTMRSVIIYIQPKVKQWWDNVNAYDPSKVTTVKMANFKYNEDDTIVIPGDIPEDTLVDCNGRYSLLTVTAKDKNGTVNGVHKIYYTNDVKYDGEDGSLQIKALKDDAGYLVISAPLMTDVSAYDYIEFYVYNPSEATSAARISEVWDDVFVVEPGTWERVRVDVSDIISGKIVDPFTSAKISATNVANICFYIREIAAGSSIYVSSIKGVKSEDLRTIDCGKDTYMGVVDVENAGSFDQYCERLIGEGYEKISERTAGENMFATFVNTEEYRYVYYTPYNAQMRIVTGPKEVLLREDYSVNTNETVTPFIASIPQPSDGEGFIFRLPDGRFVIMDGGWQGEDRVYNTFNKLVGADSKIVIAAWFISHPHDDHYPAFLDFLKAHGQDENVTIERVIYNYGSTDMYSISDAGNPAGLNVPDQVNRLYNGMATYGQGIPFLKAHTGQLIDFGSATVEILYTIEDLIPNALPNINDSSMVIRLTLADNTIVLLNDTAHKSGPILHDLWGSYLKSDIVQVAHHGTWPSVESIYHDIAAEVLLYPCMREFLQYYLVDSRYPNVYKAFLSYAKDMYVCGDDVVVINLPYVMQNNIEAETEEVLNPTKEYTTPSVIPENTLVDTNADYALQSISTKMNVGRFRATYSTEVKIANELGSVKITCSRDGDGYFVLSNPLIKDISDYDYIEFQVYNPSARDIYISVAWVSGVTIPAGQWGTVRVDIGSYLNSAIKDPLTSDVISATDITNTAFYIKNAVVGDVFYISSIKAVAVQVIEAVKLPDSPETAVVDCASSSATSNLVLSGGSNTLAYTTEKAFGDETGSLKLTAKSSDARYLVLKNPLLKDVSAYDYIEFHVFNPGTANVIISTGWLSASVVNCEPNKWTTYRVPTIWFDGNVHNGNTQYIIDYYVADGSKRVYSSNIANMFFYVRNIAVSNCIYISSITVGNYIKNDIALSTGEVGLTVGESKSVGGVWYNENGEAVDSASLTWKTENSSIATVSSGNITAVSSGETRVSVSYNGVTKYIKVFVSSPLTAENVNSFSEDYINIYGRSYLSGGNLHLDKSASAVELGIVGTELIVTLNSSGISYMRVFVDNDEIGYRIQIRLETHTYRVASGLAGGYHKIRLVKATEEQHANWEISAFSAAAFATVPEKPALKIEFIGDSITAGYGNLGATGSSWSQETSDSSKTYAYFAAQELGADYSTVAWSGICTKAYHWSATMNMDTLYRQVSVANAEEYAFNFNPNVIVLNLGTNEASYLSSNSSYGSEFPNDYKAFLEFLRKKNPTAKIICLYGMMGTNSTIDSGIRSAISSLGDDNIVYNPITITANTVGGAGHPSLAAQKTWGDALAEYIEISID